MKGMLSLAAVVSLCLYFSGTIQTILTPKVQFLTPQKGQLTEKLQRPCTLVFTHQTPFYFEVDDAVVIKNVFVRPGDKVQEGDVLFELQLANEASMEKELDARYRNALLSRLDFQRRNADVALSEKEKSYLAAFQAFQAAALKEAELGQRVRQLTSYSFELTAGGYPEGADKPLKAAVDEWRKANEQKNEAEAAFMAASRLRIGSKAQYYISDYQAIERQMLEVQTDMQTFHSKKERIRFVAAPHAGYVVSVDVSVWDEYHGQSPLCVLTEQEGEALLQAGLSNVKSQIAKGTSALVEAEAGTFQSTVRETSINDKGEKYAILEMPEDLLALFPLRVIDQLQMTARMDVVSPERHFLVPMSAIHGTGDHRFVYIIEENQPAVGPVQMRVRQLNISILDEADGVAAVGEDLSRARLAYYEDRPLSNGALVTGYVQ